jgi:DNA (cytosine-5)-methyltransferase 1
MTAASTLRTQPRPGALAVPRHRRPPLRAVSLFSGAGGFCEGVRLAGYKIVCAVESDPSACLTHEANFPEVPLFRGDIRRFLINEQEGVPSSEDFADAPVDLVFGGPPCQGFSQIGPRDENDPRNLLYKEFVRVLESLRPRAFVMENVPNILAMKNGQYRERIVKAFRKAGYQRTTIVTLTAADFGVPQERRRVFFIGLRDGLPFEGSFDRTCALLFAVRASNSRITVHQAISDLPERIASDDGALPYPERRPGRYTEYQKLMRLDFDTALLTKQAKAAQLADAPVLHNHHTKGIEERRRRIIEAIRPGRRGDSLPAELWSGTRAHKWRRLDPKRPSYTILAQMHRDLSEWIHPEFDRWITVREAARLQSFHDGFRFCGSECQQLKQVGNAVPPLLALAVAGVVKKLLLRTAASPPRYAAQNR